MMPNRPVALGCRFSRNAFLLSRACPRSVPADPYVWYCRNNPGKYTPGTLSVWSEVMRAVPDSQVPSH